MTPDEVSAIRTAYLSGMHLLPLHMREGITAYLEAGRPTGGFLTALLHGDHERAKAVADPENRRRWDAWMQFFLAHMPAKAFGTPAKVAAWRKMGGLSGMVDGT